MDGKDSFDAFYRDSYPRLVRQLWAVTGSRQDAEDVVQEAFVRAAARWGRVGTYDLPEAWVRQVAIRLASNELRRVRRGLSALLRLRPGRQDGPSEDRPALVTALRDLPLRYRQVLVLHYLVDLPVQQVAAELGLPQGTVTTQLARGRLALAQRLGPDHNQHEAQNV
jgi:RNA polymerase sigma-70 factor (ECF subfamily)